MRSLEINLDIFSEPLRSVEVPSDPAAPGDVHRSYLIRPWHLCWRSGAMIANAPQNSAPSSSSIDNIYHITILTYYS